MLQGERSEQGMQMGAWSLSTQYLSPRRDERRNFPCPAARKTIKKNPGPRLHFQGSYFGVWHNTAMWFHSKENSEDSARCWGSPGGTQPTQPCQHCDHFPNPLSQELPCALREYDSSLHKPKYHCWPWDWGLYPTHYQKLSPSPLAPAGP